MKNANEILIVDLEMICREDDKFPEGEYPEIIQFGYCFLNKDTLEIWGKENIFIKPQTPLPKIEQFCYDFLKITPKQLKQGVSWCDACQNMIKKRGLKQYMWCAWGDDDKVIWQECSKRGASLPVSDSFFDLSQVYSFFMNKKKNLGLIKVLNDLGMEFEGEVHKADDDAYNTARILKYLITKTRFGV